jgi:hypothetical protein
MAQQQPQTDQQLVATHDPSLGYDWDETWRRISCHLDPQQQQLILEWMQQQPVIQDLLQLHVMFKASQERAMGTLLKMGSMYEELLDEYAAFRAHAVAQIEDLVHQLDEAQAAAEEGDEGDDADADEGEDDSFNVAPELGPTQGSERQGSCSGALARGAGGWAGGRHRHFMPSPPTPATSTNHID